MNLKLSRLLLPSILVGALLAARAAGAESAQDPGQTVRAANDQVLAIIYEQPAGGLPLAPTAGNREPVPTLRKGCDRDVGPRPRRPDRQTRQGPGPLDRRSPTNEPKCNEGAVTFRSWSRPAAPPAHLWLIAVPRWPQSASERR